LAMLSIEASCVRSRCRLGWCHKDFACQKTRS